MGLRRVLRPRMPRRTVRLRFTLLYGCLFLASGAALLTITYALVRHRLSTLRVSSGGPASAGRAGGQVYASSPVADSVHAWEAAALHQLLDQSGIALAITAVLAIALGWLMAGRVLRPLQAITASARRMSEHDLHQRLALSGPRDELKELGDTIDALLARLDAAFDSQRRFVANASHELRTPLMLTQTLLQVALADPALTLGSLRTACQEVLAACKEQDRLIDALLTLARSQRGLDHRESLDLAGITRQILRAHQPEAATRGLHIDTVLAPALVSGDPRLAEILISNLLENAIRHNNPGGRIHVTTSADQGQAVLAVTNTGPHVPADQAGRLLQPFQRLDGKRGHEHQGLGLGLSIVAAIASAHEATLSVHPRPTGGLTIEVRFRPASTDPGPSGGGGTIMTLGGVST